VLLGELWGQVLHYGLASVRGRDHFIDVALIEHADLLLQYVFEIVYTILVTVRHESGHSKAISSHISAPCHRHRLYLARHALQMLVVFGSYSG
jgi:hypothetical protein